MKTLNSTVAMLALLAGTAMTPVAAHAQDLGTGVNQSQGMDQGSSQGGDDELLLKKRQNQATSGEETQMPDAQQQDQAETNDVQDPASQNQDQAADDELLKKRNKSGDQAQSPRQDSQSEDQATDQDQIKRKHKSDDQAKSRSDEEQDQNTADRERRKDRNADQDTAKDTRAKNTDDTASDDNVKIDKNKDQAASDKPSDETTASINISADQKTVIKNTIVKANVKPVDIDIKVSIGVKVPKKIKLHRLPPRVVEILPAYREYEYFILADGRIVIVQPDTYEVVYILVV